MEELNTDSDGKVRLYEPNMPDHGDTDYKSISSKTTDDNGYIKNDIVHTYNYSKTFCDGHPAPEFQEVPAEEEDPDTGEITNQDAIDDAQEQNKTLAETWIATFEECESNDADDTTHFHWLQSDVDKSVIEEVASSGGDPGDRPDAGDTASAPPDEAFSSSGCESDCQATYDKFIQLKYSYMYQETKAREGYTLHNIHTDDVPIEGIQTNSSEGGAVSSFNGDHDNELGGVTATFTTTARPRLFAAKSPVKKEETKTESESKTPDEIKKLESTDEHLDIVRADAEGAVTDEEDTEPEEEVKTKKLKTLKITSASPSETKKEDGTETDVKILKDSADKLSTEKNAVEEVGAKEDKTTEGTTEKTTGKTTEETTEETTEKTTEKTTEVDASECLTSETKETNVKILSSSGETEESIPPEKGEKKETEKKAEEDDEKEAEEIKEEEDGIIENDLDEAELASGSESKPKKTEKTSLGAKIKMLLSPVASLFTGLLGAAKADDSGGGESLYPKAYEDCWNDPSEGHDVTEGPHDLWSHTTDIHRGIR